MRTNPCHSKLTWRDHSRFSICQFGYLHYTKRVPETSRVIGFFYLSDEFFVVSPVQHAILQSWRNLFAKQVGDQVTVFLLNGAATWLEHVLDCFDDCNRNIILQSYRWFTRMIYLSKFVANILYGFCIFLGLLIYTLVIVVALISLHNLGLHDQIERWFLNLGGIYNLRTRVTWELLETAIVFWI